MSPDQERRLEEVFSAARDLPPQERTTFLDRACGDDAELRRQADSLLAAHEHTGQFLQPAAALLTPNSPVAKPGNRVGRYKLLEQIGEGGLGVVWMADQEEPVRRRVALNIIKSGMDTKEVVARFEAERQALAMMDHPQHRHRRGATLLRGGIGDGGAPYQRTVSKSQMCRMLCIALTVSMTHAPWHSRTHTATLRSFAGSSSMLSRVLHRWLKGHWSERVGRQSPMRARRPPRALRSGARGALRAPAKGPNRWH